jgi:hypothetical protein
VRYDELLSFDAEVRDPWHSVALHDARIAAKRVRYVLEILGPTLGDPSDDLHDRAKEIQDILGELHDCDVMLPRVERHLAELREVDAAAVRERAGNAIDLDPALAARAPHRTSYRGLEILIVYLHARRALLFDRFRGFWTEQERLGTWQRLERAMERRLQEARERRRAAKRAEKARRELEAAEQEEREAASRAAQAAAELQAARHAARGEAAGRRDVSRPPDGR